MIYTDIAVITIADGISWLYMSASQYLRCTGYVITNARRQWTCLSKCAILLDRSQENILYEH